MDINNSRNMFTISNLKHVDFSNSLEIKKNTVQQVLVEQVTPSQPERSIGEQLIEITIVTAIGQQ